MPKFKTLPNHILKEILRAHELPTTGIKAEMVNRLSENLETDEIDTVTLDNILKSPDTGIQDQINSLKIMMDKMMQTMGTISTSIARAETADGGTEVGVTGGQTANVSALSNNGIEGSTQIQYDPNQLEREVTSAAIGVSQDMSGLSTARPNMRDVVAVLPEFDPSKDHPTSTQFIAKIENLASSYGWHQSVLLCAVHSKLKGHARTWMDSQVVFDSWERFARMFLNDFPCSINIADVHIEMMKNQQLKHESATEFYYKMVALGRQGQLDDRSIIKHITNGLYDESAKKTLNAIQYAKCPEFFRALMTMSTTSKPPRIESNQFTPRQKEVMQGEGKTKIQPSSREGTKCYNCNERGHIAVRCPQPQKKARCTLCQKTGHEAKNCYSVTRNNVSTVHPTESLNNCVPPILKTIKINGQSYEGFVDTGSSHSLIAKGMVPGGIICQPTNLVLRGFGGASVETQEAFTTIVNLEGIEFQATFYVIPEGIAPYPVLIGRNILCRDNQDIIICVDAVTIQPCHKEGKGMVMALQQVEHDKFDVNNDLTPNQQKELLAVLGKFGGAFAEDISQLGRSKSSSMNIEVTTQDPIVGKRYQIPFAQRGILSTILQQLRDQGIIRPSSSRHAASVVLVKKANGESRMCVDYRALNAVTVKKHYPMPVVEEQLSKLAGNEYFTTLDMTAGYYQIPMDEGSRQYTAFATHEGLFEHNVMPFGLVNAPMQFQEMVISSVISKVRSRSNVISYVDEVIIATPNAEQGIMVLEELLEAVTAEGLTLRPSKCSFLKRRVKFLGHIVSAEGIQPSGEKTECIKDFPKPTNVHELRQFLGLTGFFRKFVECYGHKTEPLTQLLRKSVPFQWKEQQDQAFDELKTALVNNPVLALYDPQKPHEVHTDASSVGLSGILLQLEDGRSRAVFYYSRQCNEAEKRYASHELEVLAIVESLERFRLYLLGSTFKVVTDCNAIATTKAITPLPARIARWWLKLQEFDFTCIHRPGRLMSHVDGMSRMPTLPPQEPSTIAEHILAVTFTTSSDWILAMQMQDDDLKDIVEKFKTTVHSESKSLQKEYELHKGRLYRLVEGERRLVIPKAIRWRITRTSHDEAGHFGVEKTVERIRKDFWFPRIRRYVKSYIESCPECCYNKAKGGAAEGQLHISDVQPIPFRTIHVDHLGPFQKSKKGNSYIIALVCAFTKYTILKAVRNTKTTPVLQMLKDVMSYFGQPMQIITDRGTAYTSRDFEAYMAKLGIKHIKNAVRTPRANGQVERVNRTILSSLKCSTTNAKDWEVVLPTIQWTINSQKNSTTKFAPNDLIFNFNLKNVSENRIVQAIHENQCPSKEEYDAMKLEAADNINREREKWKVRFDERHRTPRTYEVGDLVVVDYVPSTTGQSHKLDPLFKGPYVVTKVLDADSYVVEDLPDAPKNQKRYAGVGVTDHMKPWCRLNPEIDEDAAQEDGESGLAEL